jgi:type II secretory pathway pseudopilin PulG
MSETQTQNSSRASGLKRAAIAILSVLLLAALYVQFGGSQQATQTSEGQAEGDVSAQGRQRSRRTPRPSTVATESTSAARSTWPALGLEEILQHNPFELPHSLTEDLSASPDETADESKEELNRQEEEARQKLKKQEAALAKLQKSGMTIYFEDQHGSAAIIGSRRVRQGDNIEGFRVVDVRPDGVVLESVDPKD